MPFPFVYRVPKSIKEETLKELRIKLVQIVSDLMDDCPKSWVGPEFSYSTLEDPQSENEGSSTVLIKLETGMFHDRSDDDQQVQMVLKALADAVFVAFEGKYEVEASVAGWHPGWKYMYKVLNCKMPDCEGTLGVETFPMQTGCYSCSPCRACVICGRVHSYDGNLMFGRAGHSFFLKDGGIESVLEPVELSPGQTYKTINPIWVDGEGDEPGELLEVGKDFIFDFMDGETFCCHSPNNVHYRLHRGDVNFLIAE